MSKDTIYREDAIKVVSHVAMECIDRKTRIELINAIPSADRPQGKWIIKQKGFGIEAKICSVCGAEKNNMSNFCPNCGASMKGADDE